MHLTMVPVLSISVPSQSNTIRSNCFLGMVLLGLGRLLRF
jgi:hypothetical protein